MKQPQYEMGMVGLGVIGRNLLPNMAGHGAVAGSETGTPAKVAALRQQAKTGDVRVIRTDEELMIAKVVCLVLKEG